MSWLELRIPPLALLLGFVALALGLAHWLPQLHIAVPGLQTLAVALALAGTAVAVLGVIVFRRADTTVNPTQPESSRTLVTTGIYKYSRNPMYLGFAWLLLAVAIWLSHALALALVPAFVAYMNRFQIEPEERALKAKFGDEFVGYMQAVHRWI